MALNNAAILSGGHGTSFAAPGIISCLKFILKQCYIIRTTTSAVKAPEIVAKLMTERTTNTSQKYCTQDRNWVIYLFGLVFPWAESLRILTGLKE